MPESELEIKYNEMTRENLISMAETEQAAENTRWNKMAETMQIVAEQNKELTPIELNLFLKSYRKYISSIQKEIENGTELKDNLIRQLYKICMDVINTIEIHILPYIKDPEHKIYCYIFKSDFYKYPAEYLTGRQKEDATKKAAIAYDTCIEILFSEFPPANPRRLALALDFATKDNVLYNRPKRALEIANKAFGDAIAELDTISEVDFPDAQDSLLQLKNIIDINKDNNKNGNMNTESSN